MEQTLINILIAVSVIFGVLIVIMLLNLFNKKVLRKLNLTTKIMFYVVPITALFMVGIYYIFMVQTYGYEILFSVILTIIYIVLLILTLFANLKSLKKANMIATKLALGEFSFKDEIYGSKELFNLQKNFELLKQNNKINSEIVSKIYREFYKFIPYQFFDFLGKKDIFELSLGSGVQKEVTVLFCDIRDSFKMSETLSLAENFKLINSYLTVVAKAVRKYNGFVDKYLGDGVLCVFLNSNNAMDCAVEIAKDIESRNLVKVGDRKIEFGIAMHTGKVVIGVIGEKYRLSPTIISDSVNLASRLENINKIFGTRIIFTKDTLDALCENQTVSYRYLGTLQLDDNKDLIPLFENVDCFDKLQKKLLIENASDFENGVRLYEKKDFQKAKQYFMSVNNKMPEDNVSKLYLKKCNYKLKQQFKK